MSEAQRIPFSFENSAPGLFPACRPSKIVCVGRNYLEHARELGNPVPQEPLIFLKPPSAMIGHGEAIVIPSISEFVSFEGELGVVIGRRARNLRLDEAADCVYGFTCVNDVTARDLQKRDGQWSRAKGFDTFCPVGPWIVPRESVELEAVRIRTYVGSELKQDAPLSDMIFPIPALIAHITQFMTLEAGDLIATGTPPGVGRIQAGDTVRVEIDGIGALENPVISE